MTEELRIQGDNLRVVEPQETPDQTLRYLDSRIAQLRATAVIRRSTPEFNRHVHKLLCTMRIRRRWLSSLSEEQRARLAAKISACYR